MYSTLLSILTFGMVSLSVPSMIAGSTLNIDIAPPAEPIDIASHLSASGVVIYDLHSGQSLFSLDESDKRPMASLTKLMTALIIVENHDLSEVVTIQLSGGDVDGNVAYLPHGERFTVGSLLSAVLISSANDAARELALYHSGSVEAFVSQMNERSEALGLQSTSFANASGLDHPDQWSTPRDIALLTRFAFRHPEIAQRMGKRGSRIWSREGTVIDLVHTHTLLHALHPSTAQSTEGPRILAGKTGTTDGAGQCLVSVVEKDDRNLLIVLLNSHQRYEDMRAIMASLDDDVEVLAQRQ